MVNSKENWISNPNLNFDFIHSTKIRKEGRNRNKWCNWRWKKSSLKRIRLRKLVQDLKWISFYRIVKIDFHFIFLFIVNFCKSKIELFLLLVRKKQFWYNHHSRTKRRLPTSFSLINGKYSELKWFYLF